MNHSGYTLTELLIVITSLVTIAGSFFVLYIAWHFISKYW
jgi:Tfp pilus assembly protein FimT